jgi:hypothetical protein
MTWSDSPHWFAEPWVDLSIRFRGNFPEGRVFWVKIAGDREQARGISELLGRVLEADEADDGRASFSIAIGGGTVLA